MSEDPLNRFEKTYAEPLKRDELCNLAAATPAFRDLSWNHVVTLVRFIHTYRIPKGQAVFSEGEPGDFLALVLAGRMEILEVDENDRLKVLARLGPGKTLDEMAMIDGERRSATSRAAEDTVLVVLTRGRFETLIARHAGLGVRVLILIARILSQRLRLASSQLVDHLLAPLAASRALRPRSRAAAFSPV